MFGTMINAITAPGETFETIVKEFNLKQALMPIALLMGLALVSGFVLQDLIADMQWEQIEKSIEGNTQISEEQKDEILSNQYDRVYSETGMSAIFTYVSMAISWPMRIAFWSLFAMLTANLFLGGGGKYGQIFTLSAFAYMPSVIEYIIKTPIQYISDRTSGLVVESKSGNIWLGPGACCRNLVSVDSIVALFAQAIRIT